VPKILIVEDDLDIAKNLTVFLNKSGFATEHLASGQFVVETVKNNPPNLILLDLMLPYKTGEECCIEIRKFSQVPIIITTAKVEEASRLIGLESGADDYVCKPYSVMELVLRIKAILRRLQPLDAINSRSITITEGSFDVSFNENAVELTALEFSLFKLLYSRPGRIYSRKLILDLAYSDIRDISDRAIDSHVKKIRKKLRSIGVEDNIIESIYGAGYRYSTPEE